MAGLNKVQIIGRLGKDPDVRTTSTGKLVGTFDVATSEKEVTEWHRIIVWEKLAELARDYLKKGAQIYIEGKLKTRIYKDKDGTDKRVTEITAGNIQFLDSKNKPEQVVTANDDIPF